MSGTEKQRIVVLQFTHLWSKLLRLLVFDRSKRKVECNCVPLCTQANTRTHTRTSHCELWGGEEFSLDWISDLPLLSSVPLQPVTLDHHIFNSDVWLITFKFNLTVKAAIFIRKRMSRPEVTRTDRRMTPVRWDLLQRNAEKHAKLYLSEIAFRLSVDQKNPQWKRKEMIEGQTFTWL